MFADMLASALWASDDENELAGYTPGEIGRNTKKISNIHIIPGAGLLIPG